MPNTAAIIPPISIAKGNLIHTFSIVSEVTIENIALVYAPTHIKPA